MSSQKPRESITDVIDAAKKSFESWPQWMKDAAVWETASFPKSSWHKPEKDKELSE